MVRLSPSVTIFAIFAIQAVAGGSLFARIPDIQQNLDLSDTILGLIIVAATGGGLAANLFASRFVLAFGTKPFLLWGIPALGMVNAVVASAPNVASLFSAFIASGAVFSLTNIAMNVEADRIEQAGGLRVMNRCHGYWSFGMLATAGIGVLARAVPINQALHLWLIVPLVVFISVPLVIGMKPADETGSQRSGGIAWPSLRTVLVVCFGMSATISQVSAQNWSVIFMRDTFEAADWVDTLVLPAYLLTMALGRVLADGWITRAGARNVAIGLTILGLVAAVMIAFSPAVGVAILGFALLGFGSAVQFPLMVTAAARLGQRPAAQSVSAAIFLTGLVMMMVPGLIGTVADTFGLRVVYGLLVVPFLLSLALVKRVVV